MGGLYFSRRWFCGGITKELTSSESNGIFKGAINTGLGALCTRKYEILDESDLCLDLHKCPNCNNLKISTSVNDLADLLAFGEYLFDHNLWLQSHRPEAWKKRWLYWMVLIEEVKKIGERSSWAKNLNEAKKLNSSREFPKFPAFW